MVSNKLFSCFNKLLIFICNIQQSYTFDENNSRDVAVRTSGACSVVTLEKNMIMDFDF